MDRFVFRPLSEKDERDYLKVMAKVITYRGLKPGCWSHTTSVSSSGYGQVMIDGKPWGLHRYSYWIHNGKPDLPTGFHVCHSCDNKECCNPEHLSLKTCSENAKEAVERVRAIKPKKEKRSGDYKATSASFKPGDMKGENNNRAIMTWDKIKEIRDAHAKGLKYGDLKRLSEKYAVCVRAIENIINNKSWVE